MKHTFLLCRHLRKHLCGYYILIIIQLTYLWAIYADLNITFM
jgi:hypothetical protein